ncbi:DUF1835 domain-containing protein [Telmatospirillum sp. J64-1]|uniref:DUF1835 domain-containing protein n=1 Tax=Telmatospirillum sp. J64-1 TaxID=2502183 RepID=UPI00115EF460|nr:DUF1835 domain-containing protein [Telmatospirillum sp. J64-1]
MTDQAKRRYTPFRLNLEQQKKRAKELLRGLREEDPSALARLAAHHPQAAIRAPATMLLADAQLVIARELGSPSWPRLRAHVTEMERMRAAIDRKPSAPDGALRTLHIRCGSDIRQTLTEAGFVGDFLEHSDPYCQGPLPEEGDFLSIRARFIAAAYGEVMDLPEASVAAKLRREAETLAQAAGIYDRVVLWCEHDSYDQLTLARCLAQFAQTGKPAVLELVSINHFPGAARFIGLGQLPPEALRMLWERRHPLSPSDLETGRQVWEALRRADPSALAAIACSSLDSLPDLPHALLRHLRELPWTTDGLSLTARLTLQLIESESLTVEQAFSRLMREREPLPWLGDVMFLAVIRAMARAQEPPFVLPDPAAADKPWPQWRLEITEAGLAVLRGERDWLSLGPPERWVGGVRILPGATHWRWDESGKRPLRM